MNVWHPTPKTMQKHWPLLQINDKIGKLFEIPPIISFKANKNVTKLIARNTISNYKIEKQNKKEREGLNYLYYGKETQHVVNNF